MNISELIHKLEIVKSKYGDLPVWTMGEWEEEVETITIWDNLDATFRSVPKHIAFNTGAGDIDFLASKDGVEIKWE